MWFDGDLGLRNVASNYERILPVEVAYRRRWRPSGVNKINTVRESGLVYVTRKWEPIIYTSDDDRKNRFFAIPVRVRPSFISFIHLLLANPEVHNVPKLVARKQSSEFSRIGTIFSFLVAPSYFLVNGVVDHILTPIFWNHFRVEANVSNNGMSNVDQPVVNPDMKAAIWVEDQIAPSFEVRNFYPPSFTGEQGIGRVACCSRVLLRLHGEFVSSLGTFVSWPEAGITKVSRCSLSSWLV